MIQFPFLKLLAATATLGALAACTTSGPAENPAPAAAGAKTDFVPAAFSDDLVALRDEPRIAAALASLPKREDANIDRLKMLTEIPAPPFAEDARAEAFAEMLEAAGLQEVYRDAEGNVIARRPGRTGARTIVISAHMDTIFPPGTDVTVKRQGDVLAAPGIGDDTRGLIVLLTVAEILRDHDLETEDDLLFVGTVGEEGLGDLRGVKALFADEAHSIDVFLGIDSANMEWVVADAVGSHRYRITFRGTGGHSFSGFGMAHPHQALGHAIMGLTALAREITDNAERATFSVGRIGGGTAINAIPSESWMEVDLRSLNQPDLDLLDGALRKAVADAVAAENARRTTGPELAVEIEPVGERPAGKGDPNSPLVQRTLVVLRDMGISAEKIPASTDANVPINLGVPAVTIGNGGVTRANHSLDETWNPEGAEQGVEAALLITLLEAGLVTE